jgi:hypothetical protein
MARLAVRPGAIAAKGAGERRVGTLIAESHHLVEKGGRPQVRVVGKALAAVRKERHERVGRLTPLAGGPLTVQVGPDRLAVPAQMPGDRRDRPSLPTQCMSIHVFLPSEHPGPEQAELAHAGFPNQPPDTTTHRTTSHNGWGDQQSRFAPPLSSKWGDSRSAITRSRRALLAHAAWSQRGWWSVMGGGGDGPPSGECSTIGGSGCAQ